MSKRKNKNKRVGAMDIEQPWFIANKKRQWKRNKIARVSKRKNRGK